MPSIGRKIAYALGITPSDSRSRRFVALIECILNQNARDLGAATYPAINRAILHLCMKYDIGILQIPCPEMRFMGLRRERPAGEKIREILDTTAGRQCCQEIGREIVDRVQEYIKNGNQLLAILGGNPESPGCAVNYESDQRGMERLAKNSGVLMQALQEELRKREIEIPFKGMRDYRAELLNEELKWLEELFRAEKR